MHTDATDAVQNPATAAKTGPHTEAGKAASSRNSLKDGLFAAHDFIREGEQEEYDRIAAALRKDLAPEGALEELFTAEVIGASWRLRRCRLVEGRLATQSDLDPMEDEETGKVQKSVDRARSQSNNTIRRAIAEMRKLQTGRLIPKEDQPAAKPQPADPLEMNPWDLDLNKPDHFAAFDHFVMTSPLGNPNFLRNNSFCKPAEPAEPAADSFCKEPKPAPVSSPKTGRNEPCPCGSGKKYKKCCDSPEVHNQKHAA